MHNNALRTCMWTFMYFLTPTANIPINSHNNNNGSQIALDNTLILPPSLSISSDQSELVYICRLETDWKITFYKFSLKATLPSMSILSFYLYTHMYINSVLFSKQVSCSNKTRIQIPNPLYSSVERSIMTEYVSSFFSVNTFHIGWCVFVFGTSKKETRHNSNSATRKSNILC